MLCLGSDEARRRRDWCLAALEASRSFNTNHLARLDLCLALRGKAGSEHLKLSDRALELVALCLAFLLIHLTENVAFDEFVDDLERVGDVKVLVRLLLERQLLDLVLECLHSEAFRRLAVAVFVHGVDSRDDHLHLVGRGRFIIRRRVLLGLLLVGNFG